MATSISTGNDYAAANNAYYEACLVEVVEVVVLDAILRTHVGYKLKLCVYKVGVFVEGPLEVVCMRYMRLKLRAALYEAVCLLGADGLRATRREEGIRHIFHTTDLGWKSSCI